MSGVGRWIVLRGGTGGGLFGGLACSHPTADRLVVFTFAEIDKSSALET